jgi:hypothetical protein
MNGLLDKSMGIVTLIPVTLAKIKATEPLRLTKQVIENDYQLRVLSINYW